MLEEVKKVVDQIGVDARDFMKRYDKRFADMEELVDELAKKAGRSALHGLGDVTARSEDRTVLVKAVRALFSGDQVKANEYFTEAKAMSTGSGPDGGFVVTPTFSTEMTKVMLEISPFIGLARTVEIEGDAFEEPVDTDQAGAQWVGEEQSRGETDTPRLKMFTCHLHEIQAEPKITQKLIDTARIDPLAWLQEKVAEKFAFAETEAFFNGDGVLRPRGLLTYETAETGDASRPWGTIEHVKTGVNGAFPAASTTVIPADVLIDLKSKLKSQYRAGAVWLMNRATAALVQKMKDNEGRYVWVSGIQPGQPDTLLGHPVIECEQMPDVGTGNLSIAFGNIQRAYTIVRRLGVRFLLDPYTQKPHVKLYTFARVGGGVNNSEAVKLLKFSS